MAEGYYRVRVEVEDSWFWELTRDPDDLAEPDLGLVEPLTCSWSIGNSGLTYPEPDPMQATFRVAVRDVSDYATMDVGQRVMIEAWGWDATAEPDQDPLVRFRGRIASISASPVQLTIPDPDNPGDKLDVDAMLLTINCVDYRVDLAEAKVGASDWPAETVQDRSDHITDEAGIATPLDWGPAYGSIDLGVRSGSLSDALAQLTRLTNQVSLGPLENLARPFVAPHYDDVADKYPNAASPWTLIWLESRYAQPLPGTLVAGDVGPGLDVTSQALTIASGKVASDQSAFIFRVDLASMDAAWWAATSSDLGNVRVKRAGVTIPFDIIPGFDRVARTGWMYVRADLAAATSNVFSLDVIDTYTALAPTDPNGRNAVWAGLDVAIDFHELINRVDGSAVTLTGSASVSGGLLNCTSTANCGAYTAAPSRTVWFNSATADRVDNNQRNVLDFSDVAGTTGTRAILAYWGSVSYSLWNSTDDWMNSAETTFAPVRLVGTHNGTTNRKIYSAGVLRNTDTTVAARGGSSNRLWIGRSGAGTAGTCWNGTIARVTHGPTIPSDNRIAATNASWESPTTFYSVGAVTTGTIPGAGSDYGVAIDGSVDEENMRVLDADQVEFSAVYNLSKIDRANQIVVTGPFITGEDSITVQGNATDQAPIALVIETDMIDRDVARYVGLFNITSDDSDRWKADEFTFLADLDPIHVVGPRGLFNDADYPLAMHAPCVITGLPSTQNPTGGTWYAGQIVGATFVIEGGRYKVRLRLRRSLPRPEVLTSDWEYLAYSDVPSHITYDDLDPAMSYYDMRLLRKD